LAVVLFNFKNSDRQPVSPEEVRRRIFSDAGSTRAFYREQSYGLVELAGKPEGDVFGWYTIDAFDRPCDREGWRAAALAAAARAGVDLTGYDHTAFFFPRTDACPFFGYGEQPGKNTWVNGTSIATFTHELGHNLGTPHASARICTGPDGGRLVLGPACTDLEYGNPFDVMGARLRHTSAYNKALAGWLGGDHLREVTASGVYTVAPQERPTSGVQLLSIRRDSSTFFYLEYRQPFGFDDFPPGAAATSGVMVLIGPPLGQGQSAFLLDMTPETATLEDAALGLGMSYQDPESVKMTVVGLSPEGARVEIDYRGSPAGCQYGLPIRGSPATELLIVAVALAWRRRRAVGVALVCLILGGCGDHPGPPPPAAAAPAPAHATPAPRIVLYVVAPGIEQVCQRHAELYCAHLDVCLPYRLAGEYGSIEFCRARRDEGCRIDFLTPSRNEAPADRTACDEALTGQSCRDFFLGLPLEACAVPPGKLPAGAFCRTTSDCGPGLGCKTESGACGTCRPALDIGADCGWWRDGCVRGTRCYGDRCLAPLKVGEPCKMALAECETGSECTASGCASRDAERGTPCLGGDRCDPWRNLHCNLRSGRCEPWAPAVPVGGRCGTVIPDGSVLTCTGAATCFGPSQETRTCVPRSAVGEPCDPARGKPCKAPAVCTEGICLVPTIVMGGLYTPPICR
jgi:hypothetical protein